MNIDILFTSYLLYPIYQILFNGRSTFSYIFFYIAFRRVIALSSSFLRLLVLLHRHITTNHGCHFITSSPQCACELHTRTTMLTIQDNRSSFLQYFSIVLHLCLWIINRTFPMPFAIRIPRPYIYQYCLFFYSQTLYILRIYNSKCHNILPFYSSYYKICVCMSFAIEKAATFVTAQPLYPQKILSTSSHSIQVLFKMSLIHKLRQHILIQHWNGTGEISHFFSIHFQIFFWQDHISNTNRWRKAL